MNSSQKAIIWWKEDKLVDRFNYLERRFGAPGKIVTRPESSVRRAIPTIIFQDLQKYSAKSKGSCNWHLSRVVIHVDLFIAIQGSHDPQSYEGFAEGMPASKSSHTNAEFYQGDYKNFWHCQQVEQVSH